MTPEREELIRRTWETANLNEAWKYLRENGRVVLPIYKSVFLPLPSQDWSSGPTCRGDMALDYAYNRKYNRTELLCLHEVICEGIVVYSFINSVT